MIVVRMVGSLLLGCWPGGFSSLAALVICGCLVLLDLVSLVVVLIMLVFVYCVFAYSLPLFGTFSSLVCL